MNSKKRALGVMIFSVVILSVVIVSAGLLDIFKFGDDSEGLEGELAASAKASVEVGAPTSPPNITFVGSPGNAVSLSLCPSTTVVTFSFLATQGGIKGGLSESSLSTYIQGNVTNGAEKRDITLATCSFVGDVVSSPGLCLGGECKNYTCTYSANSYDVPSSDWTISVAMSSVADSGSFGLPNNTETLQYSANYDFTIDKAYVNWTSPALQATDTRRISDAPPIVVTNCGNMKIENGTTDYLRINATKLIGDGGQGDTISAGNFTAGDVASYCEGAANFTEADWTELEFTLDRGVATNNLWFCLQQIPPLAIVPQAFTTSSNWTLDYKYTAV